MQMMRASSQKYLQSHRVVNNLIELLQLIESQEIFKDSREFQKLFFIALVVFPLYQFLEIFFCKLKDLRKIIFGLHKLQFLALVAETY